MSRLAKVYLGFLGAFIVFALLNLSTLKAIAFWGVAILTIYYAVIVIRKLVRTFLWRIRRKLILSYVFIGLIPLCLLAVLLGMAFWMFMGQATSEMFNSALDACLLQNKAEAQKLIALSQVYEPKELRDRWLGDVDPEDRAWMKKASIVLFSPEAQTVIAGDNTSLALLPWLARKDFSGLILRDQRLWLLSAAHDSRQMSSLVILAPVSSELLEVIGKRIGAEISFVPTGNTAKGELDAGIGMKRKGPLWPVWWDVPVLWLSLPDQFNSENGEKIAYADSYAQKHDQGLDTGNAAREGNADNQDLSIGAFVLKTNVSRVYDHIFSRSTILQKVAYAVMAAIAIFFLVIELISFASGFLLAKSITGSVHNLFEGTERITAGDFSFRIRVKARDQLGDLAKSFNSMTASIQNLLVERAEKERLAESLRIARAMQENLLPRQVTSIGGIEIASMNLPAQEVCGDYYDVIRKNEQEVGIIIADVSGKGPSAALYMAEVKGVMLSMSRRLAVPYDIMVEANRILAPTLDSKNFITMTYATVNEQTRLMRMCRAGHNPILHYCSADGRIDVVQSGGIGLGLSRDGVFETSLEEVERKLCPGDILVFYTDGLTEAMNSRNEFYGLDRLSGIVMANRAQSTEQITEAILGDLHQFLDSAPPQDDVSLVLLKIR
jgi:sigma-B regulation protein RsbU (phosphoserine phosphatase)